MNKRKPKKRSIKKAEVVKILNETRLTIAERASYLAKLENHPFDLITFCELEGMGIQLFVPGKITSEEKWFFAREGCGCAWMCVAGAVIIWSGLTTNSISLQLVSALFGTSGAMRGIQKLRELFKYGKDLKAGVT